MSHPAVPAIMAITSVASAIMQGQAQSAQLDAEEEALKNGKEVAGVKSLCDYIGVKQLDCIDKLRKEEVKGITVLKFSLYISQKFVLLFSFGSNKSRIKFSKPGEYLCFISYNHWSY